MPDLVAHTPQGLYCPLGDFHIDPWRAVDRALITHAHSDHARRGSRYYHAAASGEGFLRHRLGAEAAIEGHAFGDRLVFGDVTASFHPAGHVLGSAQIRIEGGGEVWVISGDYKRQADPSCEAFEVVPCDAFITEATFALPIYRWDPIDQVMAELLGWWDANAAAGRASVLFCYALGKATITRPSRAHRAATAAGAARDIECDESQAGEVGGQGPSSPTPRNRSSRVRPRKT
jgi:putative mRNA 3-end processing factor